MIAATLLALACTGGDAPQPDLGSDLVEGPGATITLVYTNNVHGEIEPCG